MLESLKKFVVLHAKSQAISKKDYQPVLNSIKTYAGISEGSWVCQLTQKAKEYAVIGNHLMAFQYYNLARFPYIDSDAKTFAHKQSLFHFISFCKQKNINLVKESFFLHNRLGNYYFIQNKNNKAPLLIVIGGIVSPKEQWYTLINVAKKLNFHLILAEMPGVGENKIHYDSQSYQFISTLIDSVSLKLSVHEVHILAMSFSGHLALKAAVYDSRIKSIFTVGAPISDLFLNSTRWQEIPDVTKYSLAYIFQCDVKQVFEILKKDFALTVQQIKNINIPVCYINSLNDEVISQYEHQFLSNYLSKLDLIEFLDEHGSPRYLSNIKFAFLDFILTHSSCRSSLMIFFSKLMQPFLVSPYRKVLNHH